MERKTRKARKACRAERKGTLRGLDDSTPDIITRRWIASGCVTCMACPNFVRTHNFADVVKLHSQEFISRI